MDEKPSVLVLATGGTIANPLDVDGYLTGRELIDEVPEVSEIADVDVVDVTRTGSSGMRIDHWWALHREIGAAADRADPPDGIVVTHGSNTVEETAYFLELTAGTDLPIVLTASQRNHRLVGNDGDRNLLDAVRIAGHPDSAGRGAMVVVSEEIHSPRDVTKVARSRPNGWTSFNRGLLGVTEKHGHVDFFREKTRAHGPDTAFDLRGTTPEAFPRVEIVYAAMGMDGRLVEAAADGADGIVLAGFPSGSAAKTGQAEAARRVHDAGTPVAISNRGLEGLPARKDAYVWTGGLSPQKARILLGLGLMDTTDPDELQRLFQTY